jgi:hypothetical protein
MRRPLRELTRWEIATFGGCCTSRCTWSSSPLKWAWVAPKSAQTCAMTCSHRLSISGSNTPRRYLVTNSRWTCRLPAALRPRLLGFGSHLGVGRRGYVVSMRFRLYPSATQEVLLAEQCGHARYVWNLALEQALMWVALERAHAGLQRPGRTADRGPASRVVAGRDRLSHAARQVTGQRDQWRRADPGHQLRQIPRHEQRSDRATSCLPA